MSDPIGSVCDPNVFQESGYIDSVNNDRGDGCVDGTQVPFLENKSTEGVETKPPSLRHTPVESGSVFVYASDGYRESASHRSFTE